MGPKIYTYMFTSLPVLSVLPIPGSFHDYSGNTLLYSKSLLSLLEFFTRLTFFGVVYRSLTNTCDYGRSFTFGL